MSRLSPEISDLPAPGTSSPLREEPSTASLAGPATRRPRGRPRGSLRGVGSSRPAVRPVESGKRGRGRPRKDAAATVARSQTAETNQHTKQGLVETSGPKPRQLRQKETSLAYWKGGLSRQGGSRRPTLPQLREIIEFDEDDPEDEGVYEGEEDGPLPRRYGGPSRGQKRGVTSDDDEDDDEDVSVGPIKGPVLNWPEGGERLEGWLEKPGQLLTWQSSHFPCRRYALFGTSHMDSAMPSSSWKRMVFSPVACCVWRRDRISPRSR